MKIPHQDFARIYSWNPMRMNQFAYEGEGSGTSTPSAPAGTAPPASSPEPGGGSTPSSDIPSETPSSGVDAFAGFDNDDLDFLDLGDGVTETNPGATPPPEPQPVATPDPKAPPVAEPPAAKTVPEVAPVAATSPSAPRSAREELDQAVGDFKGNFKELSEWASTELFALTKEETDALETDAVTMIPKLMGRCYTQAIMAASNIMRNFTPRMIAEGFAQQQQVTARSSEAKNQFYSAFPELNEAAHGQAFNQWAKMFRQMNPKASRAEAIEFVGNALLSQFKIARGGVKAPGATPGKVPPFQPARPGARQVAQASVDDPYAGMDQDFNDSSE